MTDARTPSEEKAATTSLGDLLGNVTKDVSTLMRQEIALAKAEIGDSAKKAGKGAGLLGGAGYAGLMAVFFLSVALMVGLSYWFDNLAWAAVVVAVIWAVIGLVMYLQGRKQLKTVQGAPRTAESVKKIPEAMKRNEADR
ncbi:phage holin family protein [Clavibacter lycopersici]|uniref:Phage holin family protein n=1 Tax=Clavibacter lycopersici TaxID=2301718 RepID=A0A399STT6_9MICO|nr:phage holin family protein [Clavibacter lycopersici]RIJ46798.1 phage holin family protein [Clavibacter lycopersici]RIJ61171.1 phage holin family protein [Clavibacter lycopersici]